MWIKKGEKNMRKQYDKELENLNNSLIEMAAYVERAISSALTALQERDKKLAKDVIRRDTRVDNMEQDIEDMCLNLLLRQQPVAGDLRLVSSALKIVTDLERIGDHAEDIAEISLSMSDVPKVEELVLINRMYEAASYMIKTAVDGFITKDEDLALKVIAHDDIVDDLFVQCRKKIIKELKTDDDNHAEELVDLIQIAKYLERVGDHAENIAEWVYFSITGVHRNVIEEE